MKTFIQRFLLNRFRFAQYVAWIGGASTTLLFLLALDIQGDIALPVAFGLQFVLTQLQSEWLDSNTEDIGGWLAFLVDALLNASGLFVSLRNIGNTNFWLAVSSVTGSDGSPSPWVPILISMVLGAGLAFAPEWLARRADAHYRRTFGRAAGGRTPAADFFGNVVPQATKQKPPSQDRQRTEEEHRRATPERTVVEVKP